MGKKREEKKKRSCCEREGLKRGAWTADEDKILVDFITQNGHGTWRNLPKLAGLLRCGKSCRLRWTNYLRPDIKRGPFNPEEENTIVQLHEKLGNKWASIASHLPGRTDNDIKNFWNSHLRRRFTDKTLDRNSSSSKSDTRISNSRLTRQISEWEGVRLESESLSSTKSPLFDRNLQPQNDNNTSVQGDYILNLWNSEIGQSFRKVNQVDGVSNSHSSTSQTSSLVKDESCKKTSSREMREEKAEIWGCKKENDDVAVYSDMTTCPYDQMDDCSDAMIELLLDFPMCDNDMGFLQETTNEVPTYI